MLAEEFVSVAEAAGTLDDFLAQLLVTDREQEASPELRQLALGVIPARASGLPKLQQALLTDQRAGTGLVGEWQQSDPQRVSDLVRWLAEAARGRPQPEWLRVLLHVVAPDKRAVPLTEQDVRAAFAQYAGVPVVALAQATAQGDLNVLGSELLRLIVETAAQNTNNTLGIVLVEHLAIGVVAAQDPRSRAWLDIALIAAERSPIAVASGTMPAIAYEDYVKASDAALSWLSPRLRDTVASRMPGMVVEALLARPTGAEREAAAIVLAAVIHRPNRWQSREIGETIAKLLDRSDGHTLLPLIARHGGAQWSKFIENDSSLRRTVPRLELRQTALENAPPEALAKPWATLAAIERLSRPRDRSDLAELAKWPSRSTPGAVVALIDQTRSLLQQRPEISVTSLDAWYFATLKAVIRRRALGTGAAQHAAAELRANARQAEQEARAHIANLKREQDKHREAIEQLKREQNEIRAQAKGERGQLVALVGAAAAGIPWWSWRRWWPSR